MSKANTDDPRLLSRRDALKLSAGAGLAAGVVRPAHASDSIKTGVHQQEPPFCSTPQLAVANTKYGKVRGFISGDVFTFKGVPYGQDTGGENRWLSAKPPMPWEGVGGLRHLSAGPFVVPVKNTERTERVPATRLLKFEPDPTGMGVFQEPRPVRLLFGAHQLNRFTQATIAISATERGD